MAVLATIACDSLPFVLGSPQREICSQLASRLTCAGVWGQFWLGGQPAQAHEALFFSLRNSHKCSLGQGSALGEKREKNRRGRAER